MNHLEQQLRKEGPKKEQPAGRQWRNAPQRTADSVCPNCGAPVEPHCRFCEECGSPLSASQCPYCHNSIDPHLALCPHCGHPVNASKCSFCGEPMDDDEQFCSSCGNPRRGIQCPTCGALNFRSFCHQCNTPLNQLAQQALQKARSHPAVARTRRLAQELEQLQQRLERLAAKAGITASAVPGGGILPDDEPQTISAEQQQLLDKYQRLLGNLNIGATQQRPKSNDNNTGGNADNDQPVKDLLKAALEEYQAKAAEMQAALDELIPDPSAPPEEQRNFLCACIMETYSTTVSKQKVCTGWVCNYCGCHHQQPSQCTRPELGGKWLYKETEVVTTIKKATTVYL